MLYTSEVTGKSYKTVKELEDAEKAAKKEEEEKEKLLAVKKERAKEVEDAYLHYQKVKEEAIRAIGEAEETWLKLRDEFAKDYHGYHMTYTNVNGKEEISFGDIVNAFFNGTIF